MKYLKYFHCHLDYKRNHIKLIVLGYLTLFRLTAQTARGTTKYNNITR